MLKCHWCEKAIEPPKWWYLFKRLSFIKRLCPDCKKEDYWHTICWHKFLGLNCHFWDWD